MGSGKTTLANQIDYLLQVWLNKTDTSRLLALDTRMLDPETCIQKILAHIS